MDIQELEDLQESLKKQAEVINTVRVGIYDSIATVARELDLLDSRRELLDDVLDRITQQVEDLDEIIAEETTPVKKMIDPSLCTHENKDIVDHHNAEVIQCADCGLLLAFKHLG